MLVLQRLLSRAPLQARLWLVTMVCTLSGYKYAVRSLSFLTPTLEQFANETFNGTMDQTEIDWFVSAGGAGFYVGQLGGYLILPIGLEILGSRDTSLLLMSVGIGAGLLMEIIAKPLQSFPMFLVGHGMTGVGSALSPALILYVAESMPMEFRGKSAMLTSTGNQILMAIGAILSSPWIFGTQKLWIAFPAVGLMLLIPQLIGWRAFPDSPKFLYLVKRCKKSALDSLHWFHGKNADTLTHISEYEQEAHLSHTSKASSTDSLIDIIKTPHLFMPFKLCVVSRLGFRMGGDAVNTQYLSDIIMSFGVDDEYTSLAMCIVFLLSTVISLFVAMVLIDKLGRRILLLLSMAVDFIGIALMYAAMLFTHRPLLTEYFGVLGTFLMSASSPLGLEKLPALMVAELCPQSSQSVTISISMWLGTLGSIVQSLLFPFMERTMGAHVWVSFMAIELLAFIYLFLYLPETAGKTVEQIADLWRTKPSRHDHGYTEIGEPDAADRQKPIPTNSEKHDERKSLLHKKSKSFA